MFLFFFLPLSLSRPRVTFEAFSVAISSSILHLALLASAFSQGEHFLPSYKFFFALALAKPRLLAFHIYAEPVVGTGINRKT